MYENRCVKDAELHMKTSVGVGRFTIERDAITMDSKAETHALQRWFVSAIQLAQFSIAVLWFR